MLTRANIGLKMRLTSRREKAFRTDLRTNLLIEMLGASKNIGKQDLSTDWVKGGGRIFVQVQLNRLQNNVEYIIQNETLSNFRQGS